MTHAEQKTYSRSEALPNELKRYLCGVVAGVRTVLDEGERMRSTGG